MIAYKCQYCGSGELEPLGDGRKAMCEYCNHVTVLPTIDVEAYNQANELRKRCDFDQAVVAFERIVSEKPEDSESYWNLLLSKYGVEYVEEKGKQVPTIHRMTYASILEDPDYLKALEYADGFSRRMYEEEAAKIERILKRATQIAHSQPAYDIFISYKESNADKSRTEDSGIAQNIYDALKDKHPELNIFLSRITLKETAAGLEYEPIIFSALNTAKLMIVVGTCKENIEATWVKNEWSRFRKMMDKDSKNKFMTVVFKKGMNPAEDFPKELRLFSIQATEATGFYLQDFVAGVEELLNLKKPTTILDSSQIYQTTSSRQVDNLLIRADQALELGNKSEAISFFEKALALDAQCARAWWGMFKMETDNMRHVDNTKKFTLSSQALNNWRMVERYASGDEKAYYLNQYEEYKNRWNKAYQKREDKLAEAARIKRVEEGIATLKEKTGNGKLFDSYNQYGPDSKFIKDLLEDADGNDLKWVQNFCKRYEENHEKFMELQSYKSTDPVAQIQAKSQYKELKASFDKTKEAENRAKKATNGVYFASVVVMAIITAITWFLTSDIAFAPDLLPISSHLLPLIVATAAFYTVFNFLGIGRRDVSKTLIWAAVPALAAYFFCQYLFVTGARKINPEIPMTTVLSGLYLLIALAIVLVFIFLIFVHIIAAVIFLAVGMGLFNMIPGAENASFLENAELAPSGHIFTIMLLIMFAATGITVFRYIKNKGALAILSGARTKREAAEEEYNKFFESELEKCREPYKDYMDAKYLKHMSKKDV